MVVNLPFAIIIGTSLVFHTGDTNSAGSEKNGFTWLV